ncbi:HAD-IA family hydrolase [Streptomyces sp. RFCAC02]|uniref:HAD-IA family hydrolase n=1 Tax=Streptomyces sp. RFCAC02 TaxID=2499143 RepID=UPI00101F1BDA|nr:HAD-IA family hydrolase [Streptomyces sp. RFCAC02]
MRTARLTVRGFLLDMDGTLVNSEAVVARVWGEWAVEHGFDPEAILPFVHGRQAWASMAELLPDRPMERNLEDGRRHLAKEMADVDGIVPVPGAPEFLAALRGAPHALVTSADLPLATARMTAAGLPMPAVRVTAEQVGASKPDPEGFLKGAAELGLDPADCLVLEDSAAGVAAGRAAGMRVIGVGRGAAEHKPTVTVDTLERVTVEPSGDGTYLVVIDES